jgi:hypothetical protein
MPAGGLRGRGDLVAGQAAGLFGQQGKPYALLGLDHLRRAPIGPLAWTGDCIGGWCRIRDGPGPFRGCRAGGACLPGGGASAAGVG